MTVQYFSKPDARGFLERTVGIVTDTVDDLLVIQRISIFAYHPSNPDGGRFLPTAVGFSRPQVRSGSRCDRKERSKGNRMTAAQHDWMLRMTANVEKMAAQHHTGVDMKLLSETTRKVREAVRRLKLTVVSMEENAANHEFWDGEADAHVEWLRENLRIISIYTQEPDDQEPDFERLYEVEMDRRYHQFHGDVPERFQ